MPLNLPVKTLLKALGLALSVVSVSACSGMDPDAVRTLDKRTRTWTGDGDGPGQRQDINGQVPVDTFLASGAVPSRLMSQATLTVVFRSNLSKVHFECEAEEGAGFRVCPEGDRYTFTGLSHGRGYQLRVRARAADGSYDTTPLHLNFVVDNVSGLPVSEPTQPSDGVPDPTGNDVLQPVSPIELPMPIGSDGSGSATPRTLQIGSDVGLTVPKDFLVTSYATTKTYNATLHLMRIMGADTNTSLFADEPCNRSFERVVAGPMGYSYCDATPTRVEWDSGYAARIPRNHVEIVRSVGSVAQEKFFAASFDDDLDPAENKIGIQTMCQGAISSGQTRGALAQGFFEGQVIYGTIKWCQVRDRSGRWWWLGSADLDTTVPVSGGASVLIRAKLIYTLAHQPAVYSGPRFATRFSERSVQLLSKISY